MARSDADLLDPRRPQSRLATTATGEQVFVEISGDDRLGLIKTLPHRWPAIVMARESGEPFFSIHSRTRCTKSHGWRLLPSGDREPDGPCDVHEGLAAVYAWLETQLHDLARLRARLMV